MSLSLSGTQSSTDTNNKIVTLEELALQVAALKQQGKRVIQAHGTFDLLHLGHVKHLETARKKADCLIVTLTADKYVNKGPNRPVFNEQLRAEMLASLEVVNWVSINPNPDAVPAITKIKPNYYAKGQDYINPEGDITGKIVDERNAIESVGGEIMFTEEITFSSTQLINEHMNVYEPDVRTLIGRIKEDDGCAKLCAMIDKMADLKVLIVGDAIIDEYHYAIPMAKAAKENMIATRYQDEERFAGGVFATANHLASFCNQVDIVTCLGTRDSKEDFIREKLKPGVNLHAIYREDCPTTTKRRFVDPNYMRKMFEVYFMNDEPLLRDAEDKLNGLLNKIIGNYDVVIANDFGHGMIGRSTVDLLSEKARFLAVNTQSNSANMGYNLIHKYPRADFVCIDAPEARLALTDKISPIEEVIKTRLPKTIACGKFIVTHGRHGCITYEDNDVVHTIPAVTKTIVDTVGAGDAFLSIASPLVALGMPLSQVGFVGNVVGALKVGIVGHQRSVEKVNVMKAIQGMLK